MPPFRGCDSAVQLDGEAAWLAEAVVTFCGPDGYATIPNTVQVLDCSLNPSCNGAVNCVLNDRRHTIGAVLMRESIDAWLKQHPTHQWHQLNGTLVLPNAYTIAIRPQTQDSAAQFVLHVRNFEWVDSRARPLGGSLTIGQPEEIMSHPGVQAVFRNGSSAPQQPPAAPRPPAAPPPPQPQPQVHSIGEPPPGSAPGSCLMRLRQYATPMACASFPAEAAVRRTLEELELKLPDASATSSLPL